MWPGGEAPCAPEKGVVWGSFVLDVMCTSLSAEYTAGQWMLVFYLCSFAGWCWEVSLYLVKRKRFVNRGFLSGPILPIYGFGALIVLMICMPVKDSVTAVALMGAFAATALEYVTGFLMERLFHVRYWDYSRRPLNLNGYVCLLSTVTWAVFSVVAVCIVHPVIQPYVRRIPLRLADTLAVVLTTFTSVDVAFAVRRALDLRALLESMERYARELEAVYGGLDTISDRVGDMIRSFAEQVDERREELAAGLQHITSARNRVVQLLAEKRISLEEGVRERFASFESILEEVADFLPDVNALRAEVAAAKERYDRQSNALRNARMQRMARAKKVLRANPGVSSRWYGSALEQLERARDERQKQGKGEKKSRTRHSRGHSLKA